MNYDLFFVVFLLIVGMLCAFWMGYRAGLHEQKLIPIEQKLLVPDIIDLEETEKAPENPQEILADMKQSTAMIMGRDIEVE